MADEQSYEESFTNEWKLFRQKTEERRKENLAIPERVEEEPMPIGESELDREMEKQAKRDKKWKKHHKKPDSAYGHRRER